jgi:heme exporter protein C
MIEQTIGNPSFRKGMIGFSAFIMLVALYQALIGAPDASNEPVTYRILYFHVPVAIMSYLGFLAGFVGSVGYLWKKEMKFDRWAVVGVELGVLFCTLMLVTGMIWGKQRWGAWWLWEPRLTTSLVLLAIYIGYLLLRSMVENDVTRARYSAVYGIIGFIDVPVVHYAIKMWGSIMHPVVIKGPTNPGMTQEMIVALRISMLAFLILFATLYVLRLRVEKLGAEARRLKAEIAG